MTTVNVQQAKTHLSALLLRAQAGEEIIVARAGTPIARLEPVRPVPARTFGAMSFTVPDDFDAPLPADELAAWE